MKRIILVLSVFMLFGCGKKLDLKPNSSIVLPKTAADLELLLGNAELFNRTPALPQVSADEYFIPSLQAWQGVLRITSRNAAIWQKDIYGAEANIKDWAIPYSAIFYCNNVLDILAKQDISNDPEKKIIKGWALFLRSYAFYSLVSTFSVGYNMSTATIDLGVPLKLTPGIDEIVQRSSVQQTYDQIIKDAVEASELLQLNIIQGKRWRPSKVAAFAFLSRVFLSMRKYDEALVYSNRALAIYSTLTDFNSLSKTSNPFTYDTEEVIFFSELDNPYYDLTNNMLSSSYGVTPELINLYDPSDLRLQIYFQKNDQGNFNAKPNNSLGNRPFTGLATDEIFLIKAECLARAGQTDPAMDLLNQLLITRWNPNATNSVKPYQNMTSANSKDALEKVLTERRRALIWRGLRWTDLRRLNLEGRNITLSRKLDDQVYTIAPNSPLYALPIPYDEIALSGIQQNIR